MKSDNAQTEESFFSQDNPSNEILAQWLKRSLDKTFGSLVDENIARLSSTDVTSNNASENIFKNVSGSAEMFTFRSDLEQSIEIALSNIMENDLYRNVNQIPQYVSSGTSKRSVSRMACLQSILKTPLSEVVSSPTWRELQKVLCEELSHEDSGAFTLVLQIHTRLLTSASPVAIKEGFLNLLEGLSLHYLSHQIFPDLPNGSQGLKFSNHTHYRIVQISQTILTALCDAPKRWVRFGEKRFEEMIDNFVDMLNMHTYNHVPRKDSKHVFFPYHVISTIDPEAVWCKNLMHAAYGREITLGSFSRAPSLMRSVVEDIVGWLNQHIHETKDLPLMSNLDLKGIINGNAIKFASFAHSLSIISVIVSFENGWKFFPIQTHLRDDPVTLQEIVVLCLQFLNKPPEIEIPLKLSEILINAVVQTMVSKGSNILHSANHEISQTLLQPISSSRQFHIEPCTSTVKILCKIAEFPHGFNWLLKRSESSRKSRVSTHSSVSSINDGHLSSTQRSRRSSVRSVSPYTYSISIAQTVSEFAAFVLKNEETFMIDHTYKKFTINVLILCCKLFGHHDGINVLDASKSKLLQYAVIAYKHIVHKAQNLVPRNETELFVFSHQDMPRTLLQFLLKVASTPVGFRHLMLHGVVDNVMLDVMNTSNPLEPMDIWANTHFCRVLQLVDSTHESLSIRRKLLSKALNYVYHAFENEEALMTGSDQLQNKAVNEFKMLLLILCSSVKVLHNLLEDYEDTSSESTLVDGDPPHSLPQLLNLALSECDTLNCLPHWIGLMSLHTLTVNMNFLLYIEARFSLQDTLANLQSKNIIVENDDSSSPNRDLSNNVWDDCTYLRNQILKETFKINDEGPSRTMSRISSALSSSPLSPQPVSWPGRKMQTELQRFLHDTKPGLHDNAWLGHARRAYRLSANADVKLSVLMDLADQVQRCQPLPERPTRNFVWPKGDSAAVFDSELQDKLGAELILKYGSDQRLIQNTNQQTREQLLLLLHQTKSFLKISDPQISFDWFVSSVFLLSGGNIERSRSLLQRIAPLPSTAFLWANLSSALSQEETAATFGHQLETIVALHFPHAHHALQSAGISWWWLSEQLVQQGLLPVLHIQQIAHAIVLCILHSCDFQVLLRVALLAHLQPRLLQAEVQSTNVIIALQRSFVDFRICDYLPLMDRLAKYCRFPTNREQTL